MTLHLNLPGSHHRSAEQQQELREARRLLRERIRDDWEYPTLPAWTSSGRKGSATEDVEDRIAGFRFHAPHDHTRGEAGSESGGGAALGLTFEPMEWREREYSDIDDDTPVEEDDIADARSKDEEYRFEGPDSVGAQLSDRRQARKRKRHQALLQEMEWNDGLTHWMRRRDNWCSARLTTEVRLSENSGTDQDEAESTTSESPRTSTSSAETDDNNSTPGSSPSVSPDLSASRTKAPTTTTTTTTTTTATPRVVPLEVMVPIAPPLLPNHPIRKRITSHMYPEIYAKIILQSRTPSIPINLLTLIHALVQGWKDDGEWPPKPGPVEKSIGRKKGGGHEGGLRQGVKAVGRVLRLTGTSEHGSSHRSRDEG